MLNEQGWLLSVALFLPILGAGLIAVMPSRADALVKRVGVVWTGLSFAVVAVITAGFQFGDAGSLQYQTTVNWIDAIGARYHLALDGISLPLFFLTYLLTFLCAIYLTKHMPEPGKPKGFIALMMLLQTGMAGTFVAFDLVLFFVFWELVLVPMYFMIGIWGGPRREYASVKFFLYTLFGSVFMLVAFLSVYFAASSAGLENPWDIVELSQRVRVVHLPDLGVPGDVPRVRHQGADVALPHLAAGRPHRGPDGRLGPAGRRPAEDGHLRAASPCRSCRTAPCGSPR